LDSSITEDEMKIHFDVFDYDRGRKDDHIGQFILDLNNFHRRESVNSWYPITTMGGQSAGEINLITTIL
jgi:Ca2+-dependent lipid-binding protein